MVACSSFLTNVSTRRVNLLASLAHITAYSRTIRPPTRPDASVWLIALRLVIGDLRPFTSAEMVACFEILRDRDFIVVVT
jgi:hypothetical protein